MDIEARKQDLKQDLKHELELIESAKTNVDAFGALYEKYFDKLYGYVFYLTNSHFKTEDIVSETFEKALINIHKYEYRGYTFGAWLFRIARNLVIDQANKPVTKNSTSLDVLEEIIEADTNTENQAVQNIQKEQLKTLLKALKEEQRECIVLRYIEEYTIEETCEITNRTEDSVKSLCKRALQTLKELASPGGSVVGPTEYSGGNDTSTISNSYIGN